MLGILEVIFLTNMYISLALGLITAQSIENAKCNIGFAVSVQFLNTFENRSGHRSLLPFFLSICSHSMSFPQPD